MARRNLRRPGVEIDPEFVIWPGWRARLRVLKMPLRSEGATVAQAAEAAGWAHYNVRGFFAGLNRRQGRPCCTDRQDERSKPSLVRVQAMRTEIGRPSSNIRFRA